MIRPFCVYQSHEKRKSLLEPGGSSLVPSCCFDFRITSEADSWISLGRRISQRGSGDVNSPGREFLNGSRREPSCSLWQEHPWTAAGTDKRDSKRLIQLLIEKKLKTWNLILCSMARLCKWLNSRILNVKLKTSPYFSLYSLLRLHRTHGSAVMPLH